MQLKIPYILIFLLPVLLFAEPKVELGVDLVLKEENIALLKGKKVGLVTNHTGVNRNLHTTIDLFKESNSFTLVALFAPEHGITGHAYANEKVADDKKNEIPVFSLHGSTKRPTAEMLKGIEVLVYDIQDVGSRPYTYATTLFYIMEEAVKYGIEVIVLDRPNPINGVVVDGPMLNPKWRSYIGYVNVPYCHGMTIGELAQFFNGEYKIGCKLKVIAMKGWKRSMSFKDTGLTWIPTSPHIPDAETPIFYASTGVLGELDIVNIGIGYTLPFKVVGTPWIKADHFAKKLNAQKLPGVHFLPFHYRPFYGSYKNQDCQGVMILVTNKLTYRPLAVQYLILGMLKTLYPKEIESKLTSISKSKKNLFCQANGNEEMLTLLQTERFVAWKLIQFDADPRKEFMTLRTKYLLY